MKIRSRQSIKKDAGANQVHRLTDMNVEEVSIVDRAANKRKLLIVKSADGGGVVGAEVVLDGNGKLVTTQKAPGDETTTNPASTGTVTDPSNVVDPPTDPSSEEQPAPAAAPALLRMSPEFKAELVKRFETALVGITKLKALVAAAEEVQGLAEVPPEVISAVDGLVTELASGVAPMTKSEIEKGRKQISIVREGHIRAAYAAIGLILADLEATPAEATPDPVEPAAAPAEAAPAMKALEERVNKAEGLLTRATALLEKQAEEITSQRTTIEKQGKVVDSVSRERSTSNAGTTTDPIAKNEDDDDTVVWPSDMSASLAQKRAAALNKNDARGNGAKSTEIDFTSR